MAYTIRTFDPETDYPRWLSVMNTYTSTPVTEVLQRKSDAKLRSDYFLLRFLAESDGRTVGIGSISRAPYLAAGEFELRVVVSPDERGQSVGTLLYDYSMERLSSRQGTLARTLVRDADSLSLAFAQRRGFEVKHRLFESVLSVDAFDPSSHQPLLDLLREEGFRFFSLADLGDTEDARRRLWEINTETGRDVPGADAEPVRSFEDFSRDVFQSYWYLAEGQLVAAHGDEWVAMCAVGAVLPDELYHMHTGVRRAYRGRKLATALKVLAVECARRRNTRNLRANNHSQNASMIAINNKLGYRQQPGWYSLEKRL